MSWWPPHLPDGIAAVFAAVNGGVPPWLQYLLAPLLVASIAAGGVAVVTTHVLVERIDNKTEALGMRISDHSSACRDRIERIERTVERMQDSIYRLPRSTGYEKPL